MIALREITDENIRDCLALDAGEGRQGFVANSFAVAWINRSSAEPLMIYSDEKPVGFMLLVIDEGLKTCYLRRLMIDRNHHRKGYGKAAMLAVIQCIKQNTACKLIDLNVSPKNAAAIGLYESLGFVQTGEMRYGEIVMTLDL